MGCFHSKVVEDMSPEKKAISLVMKNVRAPVNSLIKYKIKGVLHKGKHSHILQVEDKIANVLYAIRVFDLKNCSHWKNDIFILRRVKHENIIKLYEIFNQKEKKFLVMEFAGGGSLADCLRANIVFKTEHEIAKIVRKILSAVYYLHLLGITHRDLNPKNILFTHLGPNSKLVLSNFRSCCCTNPTSVMSGNFGRPEYSAPEMSKGGYTNAVDIWSVGMITYEMYVRTLPNHDPVVLNLSKWKNCSKHTLPFLSGLLNSDPAKRFSAQQALISKYIRIVSAKPNDDITSTESLGSSMTNSVSKSSASWRVSVYSN